MQIIVIEKKKKRLIQEIRLTLDALPVLARNDPVTEAVSLWAKSYILLKNFVNPVPPGLCHLINSMVAGLRLSQGPLILLLQGLIK